MKKSKVLIPFLITTLLVSTAWFVAPTPEAQAQVAPRKIRLFAGFKLSIVKTKLKLSQIEVAPAGGGGGVPTVTTDADASSKGVTPLSTDYWAIVGGNITSIGGSSPTVRGFAWSRVSSDLSLAATSTENGTFSTGVFPSFCGEVGDTDVLGQTFYFRAYATNAQGTGYGSIESDTFGGVSGDCGGGGGEG